MTWWLWVWLPVEVNFVFSIFLPLTSATACEKSSRWLWKEKLCQYWCEKARKHDCVTDRHDMTLAVIKPGNMIASPTAMIWPLLLKWRSTPIQPTNLQKCPKSFLTDDDTRSFCEQCRLRSDCTECAVWSLIYTVHIFLLDNNWIVSSSCNGSIFFANEKLQFIYLVVKEL